LWAASTLAPFTPFSCIAHTAKNTLLKQQFLNVHLS